MKSPTITRLGAAAFAFIQFAPLAGCGSGGDSPGAATSPGEAEDPGDAPAVEASTMAPIPQPAGEGAVGVRLYEYSIDLTRDTVPAGTLTFHVLNTGTTSQMLIVRNEETYSATPHITPGDSAVLEVALEPGEYRVLCDIRDEYSHLSEGMLGTLIVR